MVVIESLFLRKGLRCLRGSRVIKHRVDSIVLRRIESKEPESCLWALNEGNEVSGVSVRFDAGLSAEDDVVAGSLSLADAVECTLGIRDNEWTIEVDHRC